MKKRITLCIYHVLILGTGLWAQSIQIRSHRLIPGSHMKQVPIDPEGLDVGPCCADVKWDFSDVRNLSDLVFIEVLSPDSTPYGSLYPFASVAVKQHTNSASETYNYYCDGAEMQEVCGGYISGVQQIEIHYFNNNIAVLDTLSFQKSVVDSFATTTIINLDTFAISSGHTRFEVDAYGTLVLPHITYSEVLRVKVLLSAKDTLPDFGITTQSVVKQYRWYSPNHQLPVLTMDTAISINELGIDTITRAGYTIEESTMSLTSETHHNHGTFTIARQNDGIAIQGPLTMGKPYQVRILDVLGKERTYIDNITPSSNGRIDLNDLSLTSGMYFVAIKEQSTHFTSEKTIKCYLSD